MAAQPRKGSSRTRPASKSGSGVRKKIVRSHAPVDEDEIESFRMPRRRERRESFLKTVLAGRGHEFGGVALICFGILLSMSIYVEFAGPLGRLPVLRLWWVGSACVVGVCFGGGVSG